MTKSKLKKPIIWTVSVLLALGLAVGVFLTLRPRRPDPAALLAEAEKLSEQNLCLMVLMEREPENEEYLRQLLLNYQRLGADPLTIQATKGDKPIELPDNVTLQKEEAGTPQTRGGLVQGGYKITDFNGCGAVATDGETVYLAKEDGLYARYHGLELRLSPARADRLTPCENGLYYLNTLTRTVQYIARDGHRIETVSAVPAVDFIFFEDALWVAGADGGLYKEDALWCDDYAFEGLAAAAGRLYAATAEGIACVTETGAELLLPSPGASLTAGGGKLYYIDENGYPACFDPEEREAVILKEKTALAVGFDRGRAYYLNAKGKIKRS
ncbi:MAG: hypothetical protein IKM48_06430 [Clostridia bacterium]|nr:hypothetical protein [Clostridia bacterium]